MVKLLVLASLLGLVAGDLRCASQPRQNWQVKRQGQVKFVSSNCTYIEPSDFAYKGLQTQRKDAYDNFLRSNIDNEQDRRNFNNEPGRDMLPFRTFEGAAKDTVAGTPPNEATTTEKKLATSPGLAAPDAMHATVAQPFVYPLRWNNPHASEIEVNVWICPDKGFSYVVPIKKPTCSGEGHQDNAISFTLPADFNQISTQVDCFKGCNQVGDCMVQVYAHSVESRTYAIGSPLIVSPAWTATAAPPAGTTIPDSPRDPGLAYAGLPNQICLPGTDPSADITSAKVQKARFVSDQYNHAYQNSDFSPYSGQQANAISQNMQAAVILKMVSGNRGELGRAWLKANNPAAYAAQQNLENQGKNWVVKMESIVNKIIAKVGNNEKTTNTVPVNPSGAVGNSPGAGKPQTTANSFRCAEVGCTTTTRLTTNTYIPSLHLKAEDIATAKAEATAYPKLVTSDGYVLLYKAALDYFQADWKKANATTKNFFGYLGAVTKDSITTKPDATKFIKVDAAGKNDKGVYAAGQAYATASKAGFAVPAKAQALEGRVLAGTPTPTSAPETDDVQDPPPKTVCPADFVCKEEPGDNSVVACVCDEDDPNSLMADAKCDDEGVDANLAPNANCPAPTVQLFQNPENIDGPDTPNSANHITSGFVAIFSVTVAMLFRY